MARPNRPWYRSGMDTWFVKLNGRAISLGVKGSDGREEALIAFGKLLAGPVRDEPASETFGELLDRFLVDGRDRLKHKTLVRYEYDIGTARPLLANVPVTALTHHHIQNWLRSLAVQPTTKAIMLRSVSAFLGWCVREEIIPFNPATKVPKPKSRSRSVETLISPDTHRKLLDGATKEFREVLTVLEATGCRPGEIGQITGQTFRPTEEVVIITDHKADRTGKPRLIHLPPNVVALLKTKLRRYGSGHLLRSNKGCPWTGRSITQAMRKLTRRVGVKATAYGYRHTFATTSLASDISNAKVAELLGHSGTSVLDRHYSHLGARANELKAALKQRRV